MLLLDTMQKSRQSAGDNHPNAGVSILKDKLDKDCTLATKKSVLECCFFRWITETALNGLIMLPCEPIADRLAIKNSGCACVALRKATK